MARRPKPPRPQDLRADSTSSAGPRPKPTVDVFLACAAAHSFRLWLAGATITAWCREVLAGRVRLVIYDLGADPRLWDWLGTLGLRTCFELVRRPPEGSQRLRHEWAALEASSDPYLVVDDDLVPHPRIHRLTDASAAETWLDYTRRVFAEQPDLLMAAAFPEPGGTDPLRLPAEHQPPDPDLWEVASLGGIRAVRRGALGPLPLDLPPLDPDHAGGYDTTLCQWLKRAPRRGGRGGRVGYLYRWRGLHLGYFASTVWRSGPMGLWPDPAAASEAP